jgi:hypothetical protein
MTRRSGFTVVESLIVLLILLLVLQAAWSVAAGMARGSVALADRAESLAAARTAGWILQEELEGARAGSDVSSPGGDSLALRAFRGTALVCAAPGPRELVVSWSGLRSPDPTKDSVLVLLASGAWARRALAARTRGGRCGDPELTGERWTLSDSVSSALLLRLFERGSYHLSDEALRYRIGFGGRQPLTPPSLDPARSGLTRAAADRVVLAVATRGRRRGGEGPHWRRAFVLAGGW